MTYVRTLSLALALLSACTSTPTRGPAGEEGAAEPAALLRALFDFDRGVVDAKVVRSIADAGRREFVPVFIELLGFRESVGTGIPEALAKLTAKSFGDDWPAWVEWLGEQDIATPPGFDGWKAELFAQIDPRFRDFLYAGVPTRIKLEEIVWGGVRKDGIPALVNPKFVAPQEATYLQDRELVFGLAIGGDTRAYPHRILDWHEMANDVVGGVPIALAY